MCIRDSLDWACWQTTGKTENAGGFPPGSASWDNLIRQRYGAQLSRVGCRKDRAFRNTTCHWKDRSVDRTDCCSAGGADEGPSTYESVGPSLLSHWMRCPRISDFSTLISDWDERDDSEIGPWSQRLTECFQGKCYWWIGPRFTLGSYLRYSCSWGSPSSDRCSCPDKAP